MNFVQTYRLFASTAIILCMGSFLVGCKIDGMDVANNQKAKDKKESPYLKNQKYNSENETSSKNETDQDDQDQSLNLDAGDFVDDASGALENDVDFTQSQPENTEQTSTSSDNEVSEEEKSEATQDSQTTDDARQQRERLLKQKQDLEDQKKQEKEKASKEVAYQYNERHARHAYFVEISSLKRSMGDWEKLVRLTQRAYQNDLFTHRGGIEVTPYKETVTFILTHHADQGLPSLDSHPDQEWIKSILDCGDKDNGDCSFYTLLLKGNNSQNIQGEGLGEYLPKQQNQIRTGSFSDQSLRYVLVPKEKV